MTGEPQTTSRAAAAEPPGDVLARLLAVLADVLGVEPSRIAPEQSFQVLGLDSLCATAFVADLNCRLGSDIAVAALCDHATPAALAGHIGAAHTVSGAPPAAPGPAAEVVEVLRGQLARNLHCDPWEIDAGATFVQLGVDSIIAAQFVKGVNRTYGLAERPDVLYAHPDLAAFAAHVVSCARHTAQPAAPAALAEPAVPADITRAPVTERETNVLLDAVCAGTLTIEQAVDLLAARIG
jgi:acyl carrier protein